MLTFNDKNITYDADGGTKSATNSCGTTNYTWDARNRLVAITGYKPDCEVLAASFQYDAIGRRIEKTVNGETIDYLYDGKDIVQEIENGSATVDYIRTLNMDQPLARIELTINKVRYYHADALGSVIGLTDENGQEVTQYSYDPFGNVTISGEISGNPFQYTGRENDGTGLYYYRARYYSPELQRFISEDPMGLAGGINQFAYVLNDPVTHKDPHGLFTEPPGYPWWQNPPSHPNNCSICPGTWEGKAAYSGVVPSFGCKCFWRCSNWQGSMHIPDPHITNGVVENNGEVVDTGDHCMCQDPDGVTHWLPL
jgi:RHS repeat-associated protein